MKIFGFNTSKTPPDADSTPQNSETNSAESPVLESESTVSITEPVDSSELPTVSEASTVDLGDVAEFPEDYLTPSLGNLTDSEAESVDSESTMENSESATPDLASEPPRALFPGSFLNGEYEIKEVISRGPINFYLADAGDYGAHDWKLVGERVSTKNQETEIQSEPNASFFVEATRFAQDEREYAVWDFQTLTSLEEWSARPNDETYFGVMKSLAQGFAALENAEMRADLPPSSLFFDGNGELKCFGFFDAKDAENAPSMSAIQELSALSSRFAKTNLAARATLRLDDEFGALPFSDEVKTFARALNNGEFASASEVVQSLENFAIPQKMESALLSDVGMERELNEDCGMIWKSSRAGHARNFSLELLAVADGMGGHEGGEVASDLTLCALEAAISKRLNLDFSDNAVILAAMNEILGEVNDAVVRLTENPPYASMRAKPGATLVCALRIGSRVFIGNVGDSRAYRWNLKTGLQRLTKDHSYVQDLLDNGSINEEEAWGHPDGSVITSHIGMMRGLKKDVFLRLLSAGDRLVLVSDGVVDTLRDAEIETIIAQNGDVQTLCVALVDAANDAGGIDNITVAALICG